MHVRRKLRLTTLFVSAAALLALGLPAGAGHTTDPRTQNMRPRGHIEEPASILNPAVANPDIHTDIAFWGKHAFQGNWDGFNIRDISRPGRPTQVSRTFCEGNQGDIVVWDDILVRSWNTPAGTAGPFGAGLTCDGQPVPAGWEGVHVFDISNLQNPVLVDSVQLRCGSHTASAVPDVANDRLLVYSSPSAHSATNPNPPGTCDWFEVIEVPLDDPEDSTLLREVPAMHTCHDIGVILDDVMKAACAGGSGVRVFSLGGPSGGSLDNPSLLFHVDEPGVTVGHSAAFTWDGEVIVFGHEPGGGVHAECEASDAPVKKSFFFYDSDTGVKLGQWTLTRSQSNIENCTLHNYNVVPLRSGRYVLVHGSYQSGTAVLDFTDPRSAIEVGWSDPPRIPTYPQSPFCDPDYELGPNQGAPPHGCEVGGAWSSYWYNNLIYETNITEGLNIFRFTGKQTAGAMRLDHLNPQTQEFIIEPRGDDDDDDDDDD
jgi:hypothetical protein